MKILIKKILQSVMGLDNYLFWFSMIKIWTLRWDRGEGEFMHFLPFVPENGIVLDLGANIGIMTVLLAKRCKSGTVHAFEPMPANFKILERIVAWFHLPNAVLYPIALGNEDRVVEMVMPVVNNVRLQGISHIITLDDQAPVTGDRASVPCKRLDDMKEFFEPNVKLGAIKIDVEGFEYFVFDGARKLLMQHRPTIYCEFSENAHLQQTIDLLRELQYKIKLLDQNQLVDFDPNIHRKSGNYFLIPA